MTQCGDAILRSENEECDDGNTINFDGCDSECNIEPNFTCTNIPLKESFCKKKIIPTPVLTMMQVENELSPLRLTLLEIHE